MKLIRIPTLLLFLFAISYTGFSQVEDEEIQMFSFQGQASITRSAINQKVLDFGILKKDVKIMKIDVQNPGKSDLKIGNILIPEGVGVIVLNEVIKPGQKGEIAIMVDPRYWKSGEYKKQITISANTDENDLSVTKTFSFNIKVQVL
jgi:hypothetical protein